MKMKQEGLIDMIGGRMYELEIQNNFYAIMAYDHDVSLPINKQLKFLRYANQNINNPDQLLYLNNV